MVLVVAAFQISLVTMDHLATTLASVACVLVGTMEGLMTLAVLIAPVPLVVVTVMGLLTEGRVVVVVSASKVALSATLDQRM